MKKIKNNRFLSIIIITLVLIIGVAFISSMIIIENYAKADCFNHIEETTSQATNMFKHTMNQNRNQLEMFADILAANKDGNSPELLDAYLENFCETQNFSAVCIHRKDGSTVYHGSHPHDMINILSFEDEFMRIPYISDVISTGEKRSDKYIYDAVPIADKHGNVIGILYGYISLDKLADFVSSTAYDGKCQFYIVDGNSGDFIMDEYHRYDEDENEIPLGNIYDGSMGQRETMPGYGIDDMRQDIRSGDNGYFVFKSQRKNVWYYTYYMPMGINNWSMQMTIDEPSSFVTYYNIRSIVLILMVSVLLLLVALIVVLFLQMAKNRKAYLENLHKADYINSVQEALISAHNNPDFVDKALRIIAEEMSAETALLLTFSGKIITQAQYWPSADKSQAMAMLGINVRDVFPTFFDDLSLNKSIIFNVENQNTRISNAAEEMFLSFAINNMILVPITDNTGVLKGTIAAVNIPDDKKDPKMLEYVTKDFFMAITNLENHNIIKRMGAMDYLTGLKNRNSFESEISDYESMEANNLWCIFIDANGLHELNNQKGHKAGDLMLCTVADVIKKIFGTDYTYRLGGDEFLAFKPNSTHEDFMASKYRMLDEISKKGYSVSAGFECIYKNENNIFDVEKLVDDAEIIMYSDKHKYYEQNNLSTERGRSHFSDMVGSDT